MEAIHTANGQYSYDEEFYGKSLHVWVQLAHKANCITNNWKVIELNKGAFGYDNLVLSLANALSSNNKINKKNVEIIANLIHQGWAINYIYWRDNNPSSNKQYKYINAFSPLNDERRNNCAITDYINLSQDEKDKDIILANFLIDSINE